MFAVGSIGGSHSRALALHAARLERAVATVDRTEAENGAAVSDGFRKSNKETDADGNKIPFNRYVGRVGKFGGAQLKKDKSKDVDEAKNKTALEMAREKSETGENAPLGWLTADQFGGEDPVPQAEDFHGESSVNFDGPPSEFTLQPEISEPSSGSLLNNEWLLCPCG